VRRRVLREETDMDTRYPNEGPVVQVRIDDGEWQAATLRDGQFVDLYGLPLDATRMSEWKVEPTARKHPDLRAQLR
jgi:hypothetical protein